MNPVEVEAPEWDIFSPPIVDRSTVYNEWAEYKSTNTSDPLPNLIDIVAQDLDRYIVPSESYLEVRYTLRQGANADINTEKVGLVNSGYNIFQQARYYLSDKIIEQIDYVGTYSQVKSLVQYQKDYESSLQQEGFLLDRFNEESESGLRATANNAAAALSVAANGELRVGGNDDDPIRFFIGNTEILLVSAAGAVAAPLKNGANATDPIDGVGAGIYGTFLTNGQEVVVTYQNKVVYFTGGASLVLNLAGGLFPVTADLNALDFSITNSSLYQKRWQSLKNRSTRVNSNSGVLFLPISKLFPIWSQVKNAFRGIKHQVSLNKNTLIGDQIFRYGTSAAVTDIKLNKVSWWVPVVKPSEQTEFRLNKELSSGAEKLLMWDDMECYKSQAYSGTSDLLYRIKSTSHRPSKVYVVINEVSQFDNQLSNNMAFTNANIVRANLRIDSTQFPNDEYTCDFSADTPNWARLYEAYLAMHQKIQDPRSGALISYEEFGRHYPVFCFDLSAQDNKIWQSMTQIDLEFRARTAQNVVNPVQIFAIVQFERKMVIKGVDSRMAIIM